MRGWLHDDVVDEDCPATLGEIPPEKGGAKTVAGLQFELIHNNPYQYTSDDFIFQVYATRNNIAAKDKSREREKFFSKGQACLRSSPPGKRYGWGIHSNEKGKIAIYAVESAEYKKLVQDKKLQQVKAMRSKRG